MRLFDNGVTTKMFDILLNDWASMLLLFAGASREKSVGESEEQLFLKAVSVANVNRIAFWFSNASLIAAIVLLLELIAHKLPTVRQSRKKKKQKRKKLATNKCKRAKRVLPQTITEANVITI